MFIQQIAMAAPPAADGAKAPAGGFLQFMPIIFMVAIFYFIMIRPQRRREKARKELIASVKTGQRVLLTSGFIGEVTSVKEGTVIVRIAEQTKVEVVKSAVSQVLEDGETPGDVNA